MTLVCFPSCRQLIYNYPEQLFAQAGVMAIEHADFAGVERLALVTGASACTDTKVTFPVYLISADLIVSNYAAQAGRSPPPSTTRSW